MVTSSDNLTKCGAEPHSEPSVQPSCEPVAEACTVQTVNCADEAAMSLLGENLCRQIKPGSLITLRGELGAGKSFLARAIIHAAGFKGRVKSPTYTLIESYEIPDSLTPLKRIAHLDLYRLTDPEELYFIGFDDVFLNNDLVMVEWPERAADLLPVANIDIAIDYCVQKVTENGTEDGRSLTISVFGQDDKQYLELK